MKFSLAHVYKKKSEANKVADLWRDRYYVRVRKAKGGYGVYMGSKKR